MEPDPPTEEDGKQDLPPDVSSPAPAVAPAEPPKKAGAPVQMIVLMVLTIATLAFAVYAARSM